MKVLLSIKPEFAKKIFEGNKRYEYRRTIFKRKDITKVVVYATSPVSQVIGEFEIEQILHDHVESLWNQTKEYSGISQDVFFTYFGEKTTGYAIKIKNYKRYARPQSIKALYGIAPPQSFAYVD
jgi:predicted transcriptional regulator